jgi:nucleotide-binding universal stress UspA family protein
MFSKILVGVDGSDASRRAFAVALDLSKHYRAQLHVCSVIEDLQRYNGETLAEVDDVVARGRAVFKALHQELAGEAKQSRVKLVPHIVPGHPVEALVVLAEKEAIECIVLGGLGHSRILRRTSGGTGTQVAYHARCSVLVVR